MKRFFFYQAQAMAIVFLVLAVSCKKIDHNLASVRTAQISGKTDNTAIGGGEVTDDGGSLVSARGVCWSIFTNPTISDTKTTDGEGTGIFTSQITGLTTDEVYYVKAYATNSAGTAYGSEISFIASVADSGRSNLTDSRDSHIYRTQRIGTQIWMAENLAYLPAVSAPDTGSISLPHYYVYGYDSIDIKAAKDSANYKTYGVLYNWPAARVSCPTGWHLPSESDWKLLVETIGSPAGGKLKEIGTIRKDIGKTHWEYPNTGATNESGFTAIPGGDRYSMGGFNYITMYAVFWSSAILDESNAWAWHLFFNNNRLDRNWFSYSNGFSVRCLKD
ncbi:MAG: fibrobacter succinogenes major paralogous domain-containing protein [Bacteroidia bacterium]|nr:fibrobacter succinogenes major paralogous domain-containing protein [Bacteroidia bacterium]